MKRIRNFFKLNNWKRILITVLTLTSAMVAITFGSKYYVSQNVNKSVDYGGGIETVIQVTQNGKNADKQTTENVNNSLFERLTGGTGLNGVSISTEGDGKIRITKSGELTDYQKEDFLKEIVNKPTLTITDANLHPIFYNGIFVTDKTLDDGEPQNWIPPFLEGSATSSNQNGQNVVELTLKNEDARFQWTKATEYISSQSNKTILMWLDIKDLINLAKTRFPNDWKESGENLWNFVHVNNKPYDKDGKANNFKKEEIDTQGKYLISVANVQAPISTSKVIISGNFTNNSAKDLANRINFGLSNYDLTIISSYYLDSKLQSSAFLYTAIAGLLVFVVIAVFMIINYGLLGIISAFSIALYIFLTLLIFTSLNGEYSPSTIAALIIGIGISVDANIITFERLKSEVYLGDSLDKSFRNANRQSLSSILDANVTTIIIAFILFFMGTKDVKGFSITLVLSIFFTLIVMLVFTRFLSTLVVGTGWFDNRLWMLGIHKKYIKNPTKFSLAIRNFDYLKNARWFALISLFILIASIIVFGVFAEKSGNFWDGINRSIEFSGGVDLSIVSKGGNYGDLSLEQANQIKQALSEQASTLGINNIDNIINIQKVSQTTENYLINIRTSQNLSIDQISQIKAIAEKIKEDITLNEYQVLTSEATKLVINALIAVGVSFIGIVIYTLVRMNWTFSIAAILGLLHDFIVVVAFVVLTRLQVSSIMVAAMLSIIGLSINDTIVTFDRIREKMNTFDPKHVLSKQEIKAILNSSIADTLKRSIYTSLSTIVAIAILLCFGSATNFGFNITMLFGISIGVYSSVFICAWIWSKLEWIRQRGIQKRIDNKFWDISHPDEQTFPGINDFRY
ncbi:protein translocase subunit SecDF [Mycoplasmopsis sturni]|uniref:protein translocase subunit SecDF n=1 Tax=Mycoplasmopsis sturni TaxID=39047 RepID=UPI00055D99A7|nr:protein translocase subunit SecDF [Mycoplasmopsis sturni]